MDKSWETLHRALFGALLAAIAMPVLFAKWLLLDGAFGHGKAIAFVVAMLLFGSAFFMD